MTVRQVGLNPAAGCLAFFLRWFLKRLSQLANSICVEIAKNLDAMAAMVLVLGESFFKLRLANQFFLSVISATT